MSFVFCFFVFVSCKAGTQAVRRIDRASTFYNLCIFSSFFVFVSFVFCVYSWQSSKRLRGGLIGQTQCTKILQISIILSNIFGPCLKQFFAILIVFYFGAISTPRKYYLVMYLLIKSNPISNLISLTIPTNQL